jgi:RNA polymerase sigma factor (sigma-70 family)
MSKPKWEDNIDRKTLEDKGMMVVKSVVKRLLVNKKLLLVSDDLISVGYEGLMTAAYKYDASHRSKASFQTFAYYHVRGAILDYLKKEDKYFKTRYFSEFISGSGDSPFAGDEDIRIKIDPSSFDAIIPPDLDRYEKLVIKWRTEGKLVAAMRKSLKNLKSKRSLEEIEASVKEKVRDCNEENKSLF